MANPLINPELYRAGMVGFLYGASTTLATDVFVEHPFISSIEMAFFGSFYSMASQFCANLIPNEFQDIFNMSIFTISLYLINDKLKIIAF